MPLRHHSHNGSIVCYQRIPNPDQTFAVVLALPEWLTAPEYLSTSCVVVDARDLDQRLFCCIVPVRLNRRSLLHHIGVPDVPGLRFFLSGRLIRDTGLYIFASGQVVSVVPPGKGLRHVYVLEDMLASRRHWVPTCPVFGGDALSAFCVLSDASLRCIAIDHDAVTSSSAFEAVVAEVCAGAGLSCFGCGY